MDGKEKILQQFDEYKDSKPHWKIYYGYVVNVGQMCATTETVTALDPNLSRDKLVKALNTLEPGEYLIQFKEEPNSSRNIVTNRFKIEHQYNLPAQVGNPQNPFTSDPKTIDELVTAKVTGHIEAFEKRQLQRDYDELKKDFTELSKRKTTGLNELAQTIGDALMLFKNLQAPGAQFEKRPVTITGPVFTRNSDPGNTAGPTVAKTAKTDHESTDAETIDPDNEDTAGNEFTPEMARKYKKVFDTTIKELFESEGGDVPGIVLLYSLNEFRKAQPEFYNSIKPNLNEYANTLNLDEY